MRKRKGGENRILNSQIERQFQERSKREALRLNKFLSEAGVCSRREADRQVELGNITIDGKVAEQAQECCQDRRFCFRERKFQKKRK